MLKNKFLKNLSWIFIGNITHAILQFLINIFAARILTTADFGIINYSASLIAFFTSVGTLGFTSTITKYFAEDEGNTGKYIGTATYSRVLFSIIGILAVQIFAIVSEPGNTAFQIITFFQSLSILFTAFNTYIYWFRYKNEANIVAIIRLLAFAFSMIFRLVILYTNKNLILYTVGCVIEPFVYAIFLIAAYKKKKYLRLSFDKKIFCDLFKISYPIILSTLFTVTYTQIDKIFLKHFCNTEAVAYYSVALTLSAVITTVTTSLVEGFQPEIMRNKVSNEDSYKKRLRQVYSLLFWISVLYALFLFIFSKPIILLLYGAKYSPTISCLKIVVWYLPFTSLYAINNIFLICENKTVWIQLSSLAGAIISILLNLILIPKFNIIGAAITYVISYIIVSMFAICIVPKLRFSLKLIIEGVLLKNTFNIKSFFIKNKK